MLLSRRVAQRVTFDIFADISDHVPRDPFLIKTDLTEPCKTQNIETQFSCQVILNSI